MYNKFSHFRRSKSNLLDLDDSPRTFENEIAARNDGSEKTPIKIKINGKLYEVDPSTVPIRTTLNSFLRNNANLPGTKYMCYEGGCGACIVTATGRDSYTKELRSWAINSCLTPIYACQDLEITTVEGIGNRKDGYHPIQKRLVEFSGTQCGYCSPGMVMNMYSLLEANGGKVTMKDIENSFGGNICRCTGYRPILDAFKSLAIDADPKYRELVADIEDLPKKCPKTGETCTGNCSRAQSRSNHITFAGDRDWYMPNTVEELFNIWTSIDKRPYMLVAGNTAHGVYRSPSNIEVYIDIKNIDVLHSHTITPDQVTLGGNVSLTDAMQILTDAARNPGFEYCAEIVKHIDLVANIPVRNAGTLAGNLCIKNAHVEFPSDIYVCFLAVGAKLVIASGKEETETISMANFLDTDLNKKLILKIILPPYPVQKFLFRSYKIMPRAQNAHAYVNAAFLVQIHGGRVRSANLCFGGINPWFIQATRTEQYLFGKELFNQGTLSSAIQSLQDEIQPDWVLPDASPTYRRDLAISLLYKFILSTCPDSHLASKFKSGGEILQRPLSNGQQVYDTYRDRWPITRPVEKIDGILQTSGEAQYVNDIPNVPGQLWAVFVVATEVHAEIVDIDATKALIMPGVHHFFSAKDIPGKNNFSPSNMPLVEEPEEIFCSKTVKFYGQPVGIILADTFGQASAAAQRVYIEYKKSSKQVIPTIFEAYKQNAVDRFRTIDTGIVPTTAVRETNNFIKGHFEMGGQYHYTMETQSCLCVPTEDCLDVYAAIQWVDMTQVAIAQCLNVSESSLNMQVRRLGGGYGGKITRAGQIACACALGAKLSNRPVRFIMSLEANMSIIGKRNALISFYEAYVDEKGKITKLVNDFAQDNGSSPNEDPVLGTSAFIANCYNFDTWKITAKSVLTDSPSHTACRAPSSTEGIAMTENIMEHISWATGLDPADVRMANMAEDSPLKTLLPEFLQSVEYKTRKAEIDRFNAENRWQKRGIAVVPMNWPIGFYGGIPVLISIFHTDGTVAITHGGVEMGQGINTKVVQVAAKTLNIPMDFIKVKPSLNSVTANSIVTGGSMTSEGVCYGVLKACETLMERIKPIRESMPNASWPEITDTCNNELVELTAIHYFKGTEVPGYFISGLSCAEVEIDVLTGNLNLRRVDILEDTGESLSPEVDVGQVEGAFIMGLGYWLTEELVYAQNGRLLTNRSWNYKPPGAKDIPIDFRVTFLRNGTNPLSVLRSKATGEPPLCMSIVAIFALRYAINAARKDAGLKPEWVSLGAPSTVEKIFLACGTNPGAFRL